MQILKDHMPEFKMLCEQHEVDKIYLFGSAVGAGFTDQSDIDLLVRFKKFDLARYFDNYLSFKESLKTLLGRDVDLTEEQTLKNPILIKSIENSKKLIYG